MKSCDAWTDGFGWLRRAFASGLLVSLLLLACRSTEHVNATPVILIVVDTLRADHLGLYGYERPTSPNLDRWAAEGLVFERAFSTSPWTLPSFGSLHTGYYPARHGAGFVLGHEEGRPLFTKLDPSVETLAEILAGEGYATGAVINNPFLHPQFGVARGFATYDFAQDQKVRTADFMVNRALDWLERRGEGSFLFLLHIFDPHLAYNPRERTRGRFTRSYKSEFELPIKDLWGIRKRAATLSAVDRAYITAAYDEEVAFVDEELDRFLRTLRDRGLWGRTLVLLTADHGEELFDHGGFEHGHTMFRELLHIPLIVWGPGVIRGRETQPVSLVDVLPTVLEAVNLPRRKDLAGRSLWPRLTEGIRIPDRTLKAEGILYGPERKAVIRWPYKAVFNLANGRQRLADLGADPGENVNVAGSPSPEVTELLAELVEEVRPDRPGRTRHDVVELDQRTREQLRALGYLP